MRTYNYLYDNDAHMTELFTSLNLGAENTVLVRVHSGIHTKSQISPLLSRIREIIPGAHIIGSSATHIIRDGKVIAGACLISVSVFDHSDIYTARCSCKGEMGQWRDGEEVASDIFSLMKHKSGGLMLVFLPLGYPKVEAFVEKINSSTTDITMLGGVSHMEDINGNVVEERAFVLEGETAETCDCVIAHITSDRMYLFEDYICGAEAVSKPGKIDTEGRIINTVDRIPSGIWYNVILDESELKKNPALTSSFPLVRQDERAIPYYVEYIPQDPENPAGLYQLRTFGELLAGSQVSVGYFDPNRIFEQMADIMHNISMRPVEAIFAYDCQTRLSVLHDCASWEIGNFSSTNISGAMMSGEVVNRNGENYYANYTFVMAGISEHESPRFELRSLDSKKVHELQEENVQMLNYLLAGAAHSLNAELKSRQSEMENAIFFNAALNLNNHLKYLYDKERANLDKLAVFLLVNERILRLFSGISETYAYLRSVYSKIDDNNNVDGMYIYSYEDTSLMIAAGAEVSDEEFIKIAGELQDYLNRQVLDDTELTYTTAVIMHEEDLMLHVEPSLNYARGQRKDFVIYSDIQEALRKDENNLKMVWEIRDALVHKRICPYFQEIHNNRPDQNDGKRMFESLMRISDKDGKLFFPDSFLPVSKEYDLYDNLSEAMVSTVFDMFRDKDVRVSMNLTVLDICNRNMVQLIFRNMQEVKHPENYVFEIVESEEIRDYEIVKEFASRIHELGGLISIDDFGSGFSNMHHVLQIEADYIKIDGALIKTITTDPKCRDFVKFMSEWCQKNHQELVCEYVENEEIQGIMEELGVAYSQGYLFSKPHVWGPEDE